MKLTAAVLLVVAFAGCVLPPPFPKKASYLTVEPAPGETEYIEFSEDEYGRNPQMRLLQRMLVEADETSEKVTVEDRDDALGVIYENFHAKWQEKYGKRAVSKIVLFSNSTFEVGGVAT